MDQQKILFEILAANKDTDYGKRYAFSNIRTVQAFQNCVPITNYDSYVPMIELMTRLGEYSIFTSQDLQCYVDFLGLKWRREKIPCTKEYASLCFAMMSEMMTGRDKNLILFSSVPKENLSRDGLYTNSIYGVILEKWREWREHSLSANLLGYGQSVLPDELLFPEDTENYTYEKALFALNNRTLTQIIAPNTWWILDFVHFIENNWDRLVSDIENGTITDSTLKDNVRSKLMKKLSKNPERAKELGSIEKRELNKIWPELKRIIADGSNRMELYTRQLKKYAPGIEIDYNCSFTAESIYARNIPGTDSYVLMDKMNFYEFLPAENIFDSERESKLITTDDLEEGKYYEMFVTTPYGFYRYELGEVIHVSKCTKDSVVFTREYNDADTVPVMGAYITLKQFSEAVCAAEEKLGIEADDFYTLPEEKGILLFIESKDRNGCSEETAAAAIDAALQEKSADYAAIRQNGSCNQLRIRWTAPQTQALLRDICRFKKSVPDDLFRPIKYPRTPWLVDMLMTLTD